MIPINSLADYVEIQWDTLLKSCTAGLTIVAIQNHNEAQHTDL